MTPTMFGYDYATLTAFDAAYEAAQAIPVQALFGMDGGSPERVTLCHQLSGEGYFIDVPIMEWGWDPYMTMYQRQYDGYASYPDASGKMTPRKVTLDLAAYPPVVAPAAPTGQLVGPNIGGSPYYFMTKASVAAHLPAGTDTVQDGHTYTLENVIQEALSGQTQTIQRWKIQPAVAPAAA